MKILLLINWKITYTSEIPEDKQPSDYCCPKEKFWFFKYFENDVDLDIVDISAPKFIEKLEKKLHFHFYQTLKILKRMKKFDMIFVHGTDSAMFLGLLKRIFHLKLPPIIVVDISSFHKADEKGLIYRLCRFTSKAFDYLVYHTSTQKEYFAKHFPWLLDKSSFIHVGVDFDYWNNKKYEISNERDTYCVCVGYRKRDWKTLIEAYEKSNIDKKLYLIGNPNLKVENPNIKVLPFIPVEELMNYIYNSSFSVIPLDDFNYSFGQITLLQQMALGTPIISADVPALRDYFSQSKGVLTYKPYDASDLSEKLKEICNKNKNEIEYMKQENINVTKGILSEKSMAKAFERICLEIKNRGEK